VTPLQTPSGKRRNLLNCKCGKGGMKLEGHIPTPTPPSLPLVRLNVWCTQCGEWGITLASVLYTRRLLFSVCDSLTPLSTSARQQRQWNEKRRANKAEPAVCCYSGLITNTLKPWQEANNWRKMKWEQHWELESGLHYNCSDNVTKLSLFILLSFLKLHSLKSGRVRL
jgi:hypothetical protein